MKKNNKKKLILLIIIFFMCLFVHVNVFGANLSQFSGSSDTTAESFIDKITGNVFGVVDLVVSMIAVVVLIFLGIKYMLAAPSEKANIKTQLINFVIGYGVAYAAYKIVSLIQGLAKGAFN